MKNSVLQNGSWQVRPVFISSTFKDMQAERTYLQHVVFPRLEEELRKGRILLEPIDLRQGVETADIASEADREQLVLKVVLEEVKRSHPFLIVLLGDRYGWVPPEERMAAATLEMGFHTDIRDKSVTALEIEFGIFQRSPEQRRRSFFYFREPLPYDQMPPDTAALFSDLYSTDPLTRDRHERLAALKQLLTDDPELASRVHHYHADWDTSKCEVTGLEAWGEVVYQHLLHELQEEIAAVASQPPQTWEDQERAALAEFIDHRRRDFTGRKQLLDELTNIALSPTPADAVFALSSGITWGACVTGEPGSGKSALFAELVARLSENESGRRIRETANDSVLLLTNAAGATPRGSQVEAMLDRFILELADALGIANPLPEKATPDDVDATFASLLGRVAVKRRVVVLLDALNQFDATPRAQHMTWLRPKLWPANARIIATGLVSDATEALSQWARIEEFEIPPLTISDDSTDDVTAIATAVWNRYHRQVNPSVLRVLKEKRLPDGSSAAGNPLWLTLALEQINLLDGDDFARAERDFADRPAHERVTALLIDTAQRMPPTVAELYDLLLAQSERIFGTAAARAFAAVIAVSRFGWRETDLLPLIPAVARVLYPDEPVLALDELRLAALRRSFRAHLSRRGALDHLDFFHVQMREAIERRTLSDPEQVQALHRVVADHLESLPLGDPLRDSELMVHLIAADDPARAAHVYADLSNPSSALTAATRVLAQYVLRAAKDASNAQTKWVETLLTQPDLTAQQVAKLANRFNFDLQGALANTANLVTRRSLLQATQAVLQQLAECAPGLSPVPRKNNSAWWKRIWHRVVGSPVNITDIPAPGDRQLAEAIKQEQRQTPRIDFADALRIRQSQNCCRELSVTLGMLGEMAAAQGNLPEAQRLCGEALRIRQWLAESDLSNVAWQHDLSASLEQLGGLATVQGNLPEAQRLFSACHHTLQQLAESERANATLQHSLGISNERLGNVATARGDLNEARRYYLARHDIIKQLAELAPANDAWQRDLSVSLGKLGDLATAQGNLPEAQHLLGESLHIRRRLAKSDPTNTDWQRGLSVLLAQLGDLATAQGKLSEAQQLFGESHRTLQQLAESDPVNAEWQRDLAVSLRKLGDLAKAHGNQPEAKRRFDEALRITQLLAESDPTNAMRQRDLYVSFMKLGDLATAQGNLPEVQRVVGEAFCIAKRLAESDPANTDWQRELSLSLERLGNLATAQGNLPKAQQLYGESLCIAQRLAKSNPTNRAWQRDLAQSHCCIGMNQQKQGDLLKAKISFEKYRDLMRRLVESDSANATWQRDLAVSYYQLASIAQDRGDTAGYIAELNQSYLVLQEMRQRGLHFDRQMARIYQQLDEMFGF